jgi:hypothetical protein
VISWFSNSLHSHSNLCRYAEDAAQVPSVHWPGIVRLMRDAVGTPVTEEDEKTPPEIILAIYGAITPEVGLALSRYVILQSKHGSIVDSRYGPCKQAGTRECQPVWSM